MALSNELSVKAFYTSKLGDKAASLIVETTKDNARLEFLSDIITVEGDKFIEMLGIKEIAVIKVDVEGAELFVMNVLVKTIEKSRPFFYIDIWANKDNAETVERVSLIYKLMISPEDIFEQYDPNYMFVPNELIDNCDIS